LEKLRDCLPTRTKFATKNVRCLKIALVVIIMVKMHISWPIAIDTWKNFELWNLIEPDISTIVKQMF
jgi:hypothetical protein